MWRMKAKTLFAALLALFVGSCSCLAPLAAAASEQEHSCCPSSDGPEAGSDCCLRAAVGSGAGPTLAAPLQSAGLVPAAPAVAPAPQETLRLDCPALAPPLEGGFSVRSSRAPPAVLS